MVKYQCYRCGYSINDKTKIKKHLERKFVCKPLLNDIPISECKDNILSGKPLEIYKLEIDSNYGLNSNLSNIPDNSNTFVSNSPDSNTQNNLFYNINDNIFNESDNFNKCSFCMKYLSCKQSYYKHLKTCRVKKQNEEATKSMEKLVHLLNEQISNYQKELELKNIELEKRDKQIDELIKKAGFNNISIQNIQNNIKLLSYTNTDISHLTDKDYLNCLNHKNMCIPHLIQKIHFNPKKPENHNIYISNIKNNYVMIYDGLKWNLQNRDEIITNLIGDKELIFEQRLEEWVENGKNFPDIMNKFNTYLEKKENDLVLDNIKDEIKLVLFNNRDKIKNVIKNV